MVNNSTEAETDLTSRLVANNRNSFTIAMMFSVFALNSSFFSLCFLHTYLKKLHSIIKLILTILCGYTLICCIITIVILLYFKIDTDHIKLELYLKVECHCQNQFWNLKHMKDTEYYRNVSVSVYIHCLAR